MVNKKIILKGTSICRSFKAAVSEGLTLLAKKEGFSLDQKVANFEDTASHNDYEVIVKFDLNNTLIIRQNVLGVKNMEEVVGLDFDWPQASPSAKRLIQKLKEKYGNKTQFFGEILPSVFEQLMCFEKQTYFFDRIYSTLFTILKIYDLDYLQMNDMVQRLMISKTKIIQKQYQKWLMMNRGTTLDIVNPKARYDLMNMINRLKIDTFSIIDFICHLVIDNSESRPSIGCSQQLTLMFNMLDNDLVAYSLFERILGGDADKTNMWDNLIVDILNSLIMISPLINKGIINLFIQDPDKGQNIVHEIEKYGKEQTHFTSYQDDYPLYDDILKKYCINDGTGTISD